MKDNSKNRKLQFIRYKNAINSGKRHGYALGKITEEAANDPKALLSFIETVVKSGWRSIKRKWRLKWDFDHYEYSIAITGNDFNEQKRTVEIKFIR